MRFRFVRRGVIGALIVLALAVPARAEVREFAVKGFVITEELTLPVSPDTLFDVMTGDIRGWWDHSFSDTPKALFIEPKPGGGFFELFDDVGNGVKHATVIYAERGTLLRLTVSMSGQIEEGFEQTIAGVWHHFLIEQLKPYVVSGRYLEKFKTGK